MQGTCPHPGCGAVYTIHPEDVGRRSTCKNCGTTFVIESDGLRPATDAPVVVPSSAPPRRSTRIPRRSVGLGDSPINEPFTWMMIAGSFLVIIFLFQPVLDYFKISSIDAEIDRLNDGDSDIPRKFRDRDEEPEKKDSSKIKELRKDLNEARLDAKESRYTYAWFMMFGFLLLAFAEIGYLVTGASKAKRVVGAILLTAQILLIFIAYLAASLRAMF